MLLSPLLRAPTMDHIARERQQQGNNIAGVVVSLSCDIWSIVDVQERERFQHAVLPQVLCCCHLSCVRVSDGPYHERETTER
jgi:hypothetical protein